MDYAQLTLLHTSLGMLSPFEVLNGRAPRTSFDWATPEKPPINEVEALSRENARALA